MYQKLLIQPLLTEKMAIMQERENKYAFIVDKNANKNQIKEAVEKKFDVLVSKVATMNIDGKLKQMTTSYSSIFSKVSSNSLLTINSEGFGGSVPAVMKSKFFKLLW